MPAPVYAAENSGARVYRIGRVGLDSGTQDAGGVFTSTLRTDKFSPAGENGLVLFRRVSVRIWHTGTYTFTMKIYVDGVQTQIYSGSTQIDQTITIVRAAPISSPAEQVEEADISAVGTYVEVEIAIDSDDLTGVFLPESIELHGHVIRQTKSRTAETT